MRPILAVLLALAAGACAPAVRTTSSLYAIEVDDRSSDDVGRGLVRQIRRGIRESRSLVEADHGDRLLMIVDTFQPDNGAEPDGTKSVYNVIWLARGEGAWPTYRASTLGVCRRDATESIATTLLATTDALIGKD